MAEENPESIADLENAKIIDSFIINGSTVTGVTGEGVDKFNLIFLRFDCEGGYESDIFCLDVEDATPLIDGLTRARDNAPAI